MIVAVKQIETMSKLKDLIPKMEPQKFEAEIIKFYSRIKLYQAKLPTKYIMNFNSKLLFTSECEIT